MAEVALYWYAPRNTGDVVDPIFGKPLHFYLFTLPGDRGRKADNIALVGCNED